MVYIWITKLVGTNIFEILPAAALIAIGFLAEKHYTGRLTLFANAVALISFFHDKANLPNLIIVYINILTLVGILALTSYAFKFKLPKEFYSLGGIFSSVISGIILLWGLTL